METNTGNTEKEQRGDGGTTNAASIGAAFNNSVLLPHC